MSQGTSRDEPRRPQRGRAALVALGLIAATAIVAVWYLNREGEEPAPSTTPAPAAATEEPAPIELPAIQPEAPVQSLVSATDTGTAPLAAAPGSGANASAARPERRFAVQVVDRQGNAVPDASIRVESAPAADAWFAENHERLDKLMKEPDGPDKTQGLVALIATRPKVSRPAAGQVTEYSSGADGWCRFTSAGDVTLWASKIRVGTSGLWSSAPELSFARHSDEPAPVAPGEERRVQLRLLPQATINGRALDRDGRPLSQATVTAESSFSFSRQDTKTRTPEPVQADESGSFSIEVDAPGEFDVQARAGDVSTAKEETSVEPGGRVTIELRVPGAFSLSGTVEGVDGRPIPAARLTLDSSRRGLEHTVTDAEGRFRFPLTVGGEYEVAASSKGVVQDAPASAVLSAELPDASVVIRMVKAATISGVAHWDDGTPVEGAHVEGRARPRDDQPELSWLNSSRSFHLSPAGEFTLDEIHPGYVYEVSAMLIQPFARVAVSDVAPGTTGVELVFERSEAKEYSLTGRVLDARTGNPVTEYELAHGGWMRGLEGGDTTHVRDDAGRFELGKLSPFEQALEVRAEGYPPKTVGPLKPTDPSTEITIRLEHMGGLTVHTVDEAGGDAPGASIIVYRAASDERPRLFTHGWRAETGPTGHVTWDELPPGSYYVQAESGDQLSDLTFVTLVGGQPNEVAVRLLSSLELGTLEVTVRDKQGQPVDGARVRITNMTQLGLGHGIGAGISEEAEATSQGGAPARISGLLPGEYWVWPDIEDAFIPPDWVVVPAGQVTSVSFDLD